MMKISKSVLLNDFTVSPVQFTSLNSVLFKNVKAVYDGNEKIVLEYEYQSKIDVSSRDWIGIFPRGWNTLQQYVTFEWVSQSLSCADQSSEEIISKTITFCPKYHINAVNSNCFYQFVYVSKQIEVLGVSSYFRFDLSNITEQNLEFECLVPVSARLRSTSFSDFGTLLTATDESSSTSLANRMSHATSIHSLQNLNSDVKYNRTKSSPSMNSPENRTSDLPNNKKPFLPSGTGDAFDPYSSHSEPGFPMSLQMTQCKKCFQLKRGGDLVRTQQILQSKLKIVMERNKILEKRGQDMKKEMERLQSESKKMNASFYYLNKEKAAYEKFVKDLIKSLEKDSFVRVMNGNTEILVKKVNYVGMEEHPRDKKTSKRERELKAVIGLQEITIRNLINNLQEKAKSVEELNQTIKLAQAFSAVRDDVGDYVNDVDESTEQVPRSEFNGECEFTLTRPQPPEEVPVDADSVLDDIRRTTETGLKHIGIDRSFGERSSRDSEPELDVSNLSIVGYQDENGGIVQNIPCTWPFETELGKIEDIPEEKAEEFEDSSKRDLERETEVSVFEDYFDACDAFSVKSEKNIVEEVSEGQPEQIAIPKEILTTAIVPKNVDVKSVGESEENISPEKGKKFTCQLSIDFGLSRPKSQERKLGDADSSATASDSEEKIHAEDSRICTLKRENSLITFKKTEKCFEIEITQMDQNERAPKNCVHQKMIVKFGNEQSEVVEEKNEAEGDEGNNCKLRLDSAPTSSGDEKEETTSAEIREEPSTERSLSSDSESIGTKEEEPNATEATSPRTIWNDAVDLPEDPEKEEISPRKDAEESTDTTSETSQDTIDENMLSDDSVNNLKIYQDSLRYEKNLEFLQKKHAGNPKERENAREKPSAILIQNGATKVALIRYQ